MYRYAIAILAAIAAVPSCDPQLYAQVKLTEVRTQKWVGFVKPQLLEDGSILADVDSKPALSKIDSKLLLVLDEGYTLTDLEVESLPALEFVQPTLTTIDARTIQMKLDATGKFRARAELDFGGKRVIQRLNFTIGEPVPVPPGPGPGPGPDPGPPPNNDVRNEYGVGAPAYASAPRDGTAAKMATIYKQAAEFLYGRPTLKFIVSDSDSQSKDPERSVTAWLNQQLASANAGSAWREAMRKAFIDAQGRKQFTREDWYSAFVEVADALERVR